MFERMTPPASITAAAVSSHELSMPRTNTSSHSTRRESRVEVQGRSRDLPRRHEGTKNYEILCEPCVFVSWWQIPAAALISRLLGALASGVVAYARFPEGEEMKAAIVREYKQPLKIEETETPVPGPDEVLIKVEACGVCHCDLHIAEGDWTHLLRIIKRPLIPGHEVVGPIIQKGDTVNDLQIGDRVGVAWTHWTCGECELCKEGRENLCSKQMITGATVDGGYAEFIKAKASHVLKVPDALTSEEAAPLFCAGVTVYHAIQKSGVKPRQRLVVFGVGGLGNLAVQIAKCFGVQVIAVDIANEKLEFAEKLGADITIHAADDVVKQIRKM